MFVNKYSTFFIIFYILLLFFIVYYLITSIEIKLYLLIINEIIYYEKIKYGLITVAICMVDRFNYWHSIEFTRCKTYVPVLGIGNAGGLIIEIIDQQLLKNEKE
jgi:hypothetical protein